MSEKLPVLELSTAFYFKDLVNKKKLFEKIAELLSESTEVSFLSVLDCLNSREKLGSTYIGKGVAIPHCKIDIASPKVIILVLGEKIKYSDDGLNQVDVVFSLLVPSENCDQHLHLLSSIARLCEQKSWLSGIRELCTEQDIMKYINESDNSLDNLS